jgi:hypothetical protein
VSFAIISLWSLMKSGERRIFLLPAGLFLGLAVFSHTTGYLFLPVFILSYFALHGLSRQTASDPVFLGALAIPALFTAAYFVLARTFAPAVDPADTGGGILPGFVRTYADALRGLTETGFTTSAWNRYFEGIRQQLTTPVYVMAILGFGMAAIAAWRSRRKAMTPILLWAGIVTIGFAIQYPAASHGSRYPSYVTPAFVVLASFFVVSAARLALTALQPQTIGAQSGPPRPVRRSPRSGRVRDRRGAARRRLSHAVPGLAIDHAIPTRARHRVSAPASHFRLWAARPLGLYA